MQVFAKIFLLATLALTALPWGSAAEDSVVYGVYRSVDLGEPGEVTPKDYYVNLGTNHGIRPGTVLEVLRKTATYDLVSQKLFKEMVFPIATLRVIHVENNAAVARIDKLSPVDKTPALATRAVMVGDFVRPVK